MPRYRTIDEEPDRFCGNCGNVISKQKPGGKWKTPSQYRQQKGCCVECSRALRTKTMKAHRADEPIDNKPDAMDLFIRGKKS